MYLLLSSALIFFGMMCEQSKCHDIDAIQVKLLFSSFCAYFRSKWMSTCAGRTIDKHICYGQLLYGTHAHGIKFPKWSIFSLIDFGHRGLILLFESLTVAVVVLSFTMYANFSKKWIKWCDDPNPKINDSQICG